MYIHIIGIDYIDYEVYEQQSSDIRWGSGKSVQLVTGCNGSVDACCLRLGPAEYNS